MHVHMDGMGVLRGLHCTDKPHSLHKHARLLLTQNLRPFGFLGPQPTTGSKTYLKRRGAWCALVAAFYACIRSWGKVLGIGVNNLC